MARKKTHRTAGAEVPANLEAYEAKRDFARTPEPRGAAPPPGQNLFVVQKHAASRLHYDFRLEMNGVLKSWAVPKGPSLDPRQKPLAVHTEDHPMDYASFEGVIPEGEYGGGTVMVWDRGQWAPIGDPVAGYANGDLKFTLFGEKLRGDWVLARMSGDAGDGGKNWLLIKKRDGHERAVSTYNVLGELPRSVLSGRTLDEIAAAPDAVWTDGREQLLERDDDAPTGPDPSALDGVKPGAPTIPFKPQLATAVAAPPSGDQWLHEVKLDGYRLLTHIDADGAVQLFTRNGHDWSGRFGTLPQAIARLPIYGAVLDGEVCVIDADGHCDFQALQNAFRGGGPVPFTYFVFDVPFAGGCDLRRVPLCERKAFLERVFHASPMAGPTLQFCEHMVGHGEQVYAQARQWGMEGIVSKRIDARYESRRTDTWLKVKCSLRQEFVIAGFTPPAGSRTGIGALVLGVHDDDGRLVYCGRVGTGFSASDLTFLVEQLTAIRRDVSALRNPGADPEPRSITWTEPTIVADVEFTAWTNDGLVRHAVYKGLRPDVQAKDVIAEEVPGRRAATGAAARHDIVESPPSPDDARVAGVRISHPTRTVYPDQGVTKQQVATYYEAVADWILPFITGRPLSLVRCPLGLAGEAFYQRQVGEGFPDSIKGDPIGADDSEPFLFINDLTGLISLIQMGVLEIHTWGCRVDDLTKPDHLVIDLDPGPGIEWDHIVASAVFIREYLDDLGLVSFVKTTGGNGIHVVIPITRRSTWDTVRAFTHAIAYDLVRIAPRNFVATMSKQFREHRIFIDYLRNVQGSTAVAPYSTRARDGALVSTPLHWDELSAAIEPAAFSVSSVPDRLDGLTEAPWTAFADVRQSITKKMLGTLGL